MSGVFETHKMFTAVGTLSYVYVAEPKKSTLDGQKDKYQVNLILDPAECNDLYAEVLRIAKLAFGDDYANQQMQPGGALKNPFKNGNAQTRKTKTGQPEPDPLYQGKYFLVPKSDTQPFFFDVDGRTVVPAGKFYSGARARCYVSIFAYPKPDAKKKIPSKGVGLGLEILQFAGDGERIGGDGKMTLEQAANIFGGAAALPGATAPNPFGQANVQAAAGGLPPLG